MVKLSIPVFLQVVNMYNLFLKNSICLLNLRRKVYYPSKKLVDFRRYSLFKVGSK